MPLVKNQAIFVGKDKSSSEEFDYDSIKEISRNSKQSDQISTKPITSIEVKMIPRYISDICHYIRKCATSGKTQFQYDCSKLTNICFMELASQFKHKYPKFFVTTEQKNQILTIDWS